MEGKAVGVCISFCGSTRITVNLKAVNGHILACLLVIEVTESVVTYSCNACGNFNFS